MLSSGTGTTVRCSGRWRVFEGVAGTLVLLFFELDDTRGLNPRFTGEIRALQNLKRGDLTAHETAPR